MAVLTKYHTLNNRNLFVHNSGGSRFEIKVSVRSDDFLLGLSMNVFSLSLHMVFTQYVSVSKCSLPSRTPVILDWDPL